MATTKIKEEFFIREEERVSESKASGFFCYIRDFTMRDQGYKDLSGDISVNGYIIQKITKSVNVRVPDAKKGKPNVLTTTSDVMDYTGNFVNSMSDSYVEAFVVLGGQVLDGDMFSNASILRYNSRGKIKEKAPNTEGEIEQIGEYFFVPSLETTEGGIIEELAGLGLEVITGKAMNDPANGLPCSSDLRLFEQLLPLKKSPKYKFTLTVHWGPDEEDSIVRPSGQTIIGGSSNSYSRRKIRNLRKTRRSALPNILYKKDDQ